MINKKDRIWELQIGEGPIVVTAIHDGHELRDEIDELVLLSDQERLREEDPFTGDWVKVGDVQIVGKRSRFEIDLNRPREKAIYRMPEDAWGLNVWQKDLSEKIIQNSLNEYDTFYEEMYTVFNELKNKYKHFIVLDLHTYNHMREGPNRKPADELGNPEVNLGTETIDHKYWGDLLNGFQNDMRNADYMGRSLDVRENVKFKGGNFSRWINKNFANSGCSIALEFKKFFMDEWTGRPDVNQVEAIRKVLESTIPGIRQKLKKMN